MASVALLAVPVVFIGVVFQRFMVTGLTSGAVKGEAAGASDSRN